MHVILLSGGSGSRLWPLSNDSRSKQFLKVLRDDAGNHVSMMQRVFSQIGNVEAEIDVTIAASEAHHDSIARQLSEAVYDLVLEPERRDTSPAILLACAHLASEQGAVHDDTVVVMPIDTYAAQEYYDLLPRIDEAVQENVADLVLLGVTPTYPSEKYGYIVPSSHEGSVWPVRSFTEKPSRAEAETLVSAGALWNCGVFAFKLGHVLDIVANRMGTCEFSEVRQRYVEFPKISFDYDVVERAESVAVIPYSGLWKDLGTWNTLTEEMADATSGHVVVDGDTCDNVHAINETGLPLVVMGVSDTAIVATHDGILVAGKQASSDARMKTLVSEAADVRPMYEHKRWGEYRVVNSSIDAAGQSTLVKELVLESGGQFSYQRHANRNEVWIVSSGSGEVVVDGVVTSVGPSSIVSITAGQLHAARAITELHMIEVQMGGALIEEDIERFGNYWAGDVDWTPTAPGPC